MASRKLKFMSSDGVTLEVEEMVALEWQTIKQMMEADFSEDGPIPLPNVTGRILLKVIEYTKKHVQSSTSNSDDPNLKAWDAKFVQVDVPTLQELMKAANYLNIPSLLELICRRIANHMIKGRPVEYIRKTFNVINDYTPDEEEDMRRKLSWALD